MTKIKIPERCSYFTEGNRFTICFHDNKEEIQSFCDVNNIGSSADSRTDIRKEGYNLFIDLENVHKIFDLLVTRTLKDFRVRVSTIINSVKQLEPSAEVTTCFRQLQRAFGWMELMRQALGHQNPYAATNDPSSPEIKSVADFSKDTFIEGWTASPADQVTRVKMLRKIIGETIEIFEKSLDEADFVADAGEKYDFDRMFKASSQVVISLIDAKLILGWELSRIEEQRRQD